MSASVLPWDVFPTIFRYLPQDGLCTCLRVCKAFNRMITGDKVLLARLQAVRSYGQLESYVEKGRPYYHGEIYTDVGQNDEAKFPYCEQFVVTELKRATKPGADMHLSYSSVPKESEKEPRCSGSMLFSEQYTMGKNGHDVYGVSKYDVMLRMMEKLWKFVQGPDNAQILSQLPFLGRNMRKAVKRLKRHAKEENASFGEFAELEAGHTKWYGEVMRTRPQDEPETSSEDELYQEMDAEDVGKVPVFFCKRCHWRIGGLTCRSGKHSAGEDQLLVLEKDASLRCPKGCGRVCAPICCRRAPMKASARNKKYVFNAAQASPTPVEDRCPVLSCKECDFAVDGIRCFTCSPHGREVERNGFFERVWCAYVWTCCSGCGRKERGGTVSRGIVSCLCRQQDAAAGTDGGDGIGKPSPMAEYAYVKACGPPYN